MQTEKSAQKSTPILTRNIAIPQDHGSWVFLFSPLLIGLFISGKFSCASILIVGSALAGFLLRQPVTAAVKCYSGRRSKLDLKSAWFWIIVYGILAGCAFLGLVQRGFGYLAYLAAAAVPVFIWHLYLVSRRSERKQIGVEVVGSGVLALAAPAAYWVGEGSPNPIGWLLFALAWLQSAASIVHAYMRLEQRKLKSLPEVSSLIQIGKRAILYTSFNLALGIILSVMKIIPLWLFMPYLLQWLETVQGVFRPAINWKPTAIGVRQLLVSTLFTVLFILLWNF